MWHSLYDFMKKREQRKQLKQREQLFVQAFSSFVVI